MKWLNHELHIKPVDTFIDPIRPVNRAIITHGHSDHARAGHNHVLATPQTIEIMNDEDPEGRLEFENKFNGVTEKTSFSGDAHKNVEIIFMNPDDPDNGNIMLRGKETEFEITGFSSSPSETAESLRKIL